MSPTMRLSPWWIRSGRSSSACIIGVLLVVVTIVAGHRLLMRGPSRMGRAIVVAGGAVVGVMLLGILISMA
jgi:hypothetical protein